MISFAEFKEAPGTDANNYTDEEIVKIKRLEEALADLIIDQILEEELEAEMIPSPFK
ncbi:MAG: hypothetical protein WC531_01075 [Candidatus Paceibacterota bacterium]|jgi:hypothetical protein